MVFKEATDTNAGSSAIYGAPDVKKIAQLLNGNLIDCNEPVIPRDTIFTIIDATNNTARFRFDATSISMCNTRVITVPDSNITLNCCIPVANLSNATAGELITWDACGAPTTVPVGTATHVLTSNGACMEPTFQVLPCGSTPTESLIVAVGNETTALTTGLAKVTFRMPYAFTLTGIRASVTTAATGAALLTVDLNEGGVTVLSTKLTFDSTETTTTTAVTPPVISDSALACDAEMTIDIDVIGCTVAGAGLKVTLIGNQ